MSDPLPYHKDGFVYFELASGKLAVFEPGNEPAVYEVPDAKSGVYRLPVDAILKACGRTFSTLTPSVPGSQHLLATLWQEMSWRNTSPGMEPTSSMYRRSSSYLIQPSGDRALQIGLN